MVHGIGLTVSGLVRCIGARSGTILPVSGRVGDRLARACRGQSGPTDRASRCGRSWTSASAAWEQSLDVLRAANESLPI